MNLASLMAFFESSQMLKLTWITATCLFLLAFIYAVVLFARKRQTRAVSYSKGTQLSKIIEYATLKPLLRADEPDEYLPQRIRWQRTQTALTIRWITRRRTIQHLYFRPRQRTLQRWKIAYSPRKLSPVLHHVIAIPDISQSRTYEFEIRYGDSRFRIWQNKSIVEKI